MIKLLLATLSGIVIVASAADLDDHDKTYVVTMKDGKVYYGTVVERSDSIVIKFDTGAKKGTEKTLPKNQIESKLQESGTRRQERRLEDAEKANEKLDKEGKAMVGTNKTVAKDEVEFAKRAKAMAAAQSASFSPADDPAPVSPSDTNTAPGGPVSPVKPPFLKQWGGHIVAGMAGLALSLVVIKTLLL